jgi:hypothetical protein
MRYCATGRLFFLDDTQGTLLNALYSSIATPQYHPQGEYANKNIKKGVYIRELAEQMALLAECDRVLAVRDTSLSLSRVTERSLLLVRCLSSEALDRMLTAVIRA